MSDFGGYTYPVGRKDHRCEWCGQTIPKGEQHIQLKGMWQDEWQNWKMHDECYKSADMNNEMDDGFMPYGNERPER